MKQVYVLMSSYYNGADNFECALGIYIDEDVAGLEQLRLQEENTDPGQDYFVSTWEVK